MEIKEIVKQIIEKEIECFGIRTLADDENYKVGDDCRESYEWDAENDCSTYDLYGEDGETANGTCVIIVKSDCYDDPKDIEEALKKAIAFNEKWYGLAKRAVIAGHHFNTDGVFDEGEGRLADAYVLAFV